MDGSDLPALLSRKLADAPLRALCVAYSGGADSSALLYALAQIPRARQNGLRALHVDHALNPHSADWAEHCRRFCATLQVPIEIARVQVRRDRGEGLEAAARQARHAAFASAIQPGEWLTLAHHRDDQIETVLLKLLRGAGLQGLGGMLESRALGAGVLWRPLLELPRTALRDYAAKHSLPFIDDPSNGDTRLSRNYVRAQVVPKLLTHWPHAAESIARSAELCRAASAFVGAQADGALARLRNADGTLDARRWRDLPDALRMPVLERWLQGNRLRAPPPARCEELRRQVEQAREDREPFVTCPGGELHLWRGALHAVPAMDDIPRDWEAAWNGEPLQLPRAAGTLMLHAPSSPERQLALPSSLRVRFRRGGECIKPAGDAHTRELRDLFQHACVPPWQRGRIPLIFRGEELIAVADLWLSEAGQTFFGEAGSRPQWQRDRIDFGVPSNSR